MATKEQVEAQLRTVMDPEIGLDVVTLGLIYNIEVKENVVNLTVTLTSPMCPYGPMLIEQMRDAAQKVEGIAKAEVELTFEPAWVPPPEVRLMMGV